MDVGPKNLFETLGIRQDTVQRISLSRGVIGKVMWVVLAALAVLGVVAARIGNGWMLLVVAGLAVLVVVFSLWKMFAFAEKNPAAALLEGGELLQWQKMEHAAAKGLLAPPMDTPSISGGTFLGEADKGEEDEP